MNQEKVRNLWNDYFASKKTGNTSLDIEKKLVAHYYPLTVRKVANKLHQRLTEVPPDELASMGVFGLYDAVRGYSLDFQTKFETYAMYRIRGSMLDEIRKGDWVPRLVRSKCAWLERQRYLCESEAGRRLSNAEIADKIGKTVEEFEVIVKASSSPGIHSIDAIDDEHDNRSTGVSQTPDKRAIQPLERILRREVFNKLMARNFSPQERKIIWLYYFDDRSMKEISDKVKLSESRVSQMHGDILYRLKQKADRNPEYFADIWSMVEKFKGMETIEA